MKSYVGGDITTAINEALKDATWNTAEKRVLTKIRDNDVRSGVTSREHGSGRIYGFKGERISFLFHESTVGYNIGRI